MIEPSKFQSLVCSAPDDIDLFLGGGRGGGKSFGIAFLLLKHVAEHKEKAGGLYMRRTYQGLQDFVAITRRLFRAADPKAVFNSTTHIWRFSNGATVELGQASNEAEWLKFQGRSFTLICVDECQQFPDMSIIDVLRSNLRAERGVPLRMVFAANPGGLSHNTIAKRWVFGRPNFEPFTDELTGVEIIHCPSTLEQNSHIDTEKYAATLRAATAGDKELQKAWIHGQWNIAKGAYFSDVLDKDRVQIPEWHSLPKSSVGSRLVWGGVENFWINPWSFFLAMDFGVTAPSITFLCAESGGASDETGRYYPKGSIVLVDELALCKPHDFAKGLGYTVPRQAEEIRDFCRHWNAPTSGIADDAIFSNQGSGAGTIAHEFRKHGVHWQPAKKADRFSGWEIMRTLMMGSGQPDIPGLYVSEACTHFWSTVPFLPRDTRKINDVDTKGNDHSADAARYAVLRTRRATFGKGKLVMAR